MRRSKALNMKKDHFYFNVKMGYQNNIAISRKTKEEAIYAFQNYQKQKKNLEWLGQWDGKKFQFKDIKEISQ